MITSLCSSNCERVAQCDVCNRPKPPNGRDVPAAASAGYCQHECPGRDQDPQSGHLWPGELAESRARIDADREKLAEEIIEESAVDYAKALTRVSVLEDLIVEHSDLSRRDVCAKLDAEARAIQERRKG